MKYCDIILKSVDNGWTVQFEEPDPERGPTSCFMRARIFPERADALSCINELMLQIERGALGLSCPSNREKAKQVVGDTT